VAVDRLALGRRLVGEDLPALVQLGLLLVDVVALRVVLARQAIGSGVNVLIVIGTQ